MIQHDDPDRNDGETVRNTPLDQILTPEKLARIAGKRWDHIGDALAGIEPEPHPTLLERLRRWWRG